MNWLDQQPDVTYSNLRIVDEFSPVKETLYTDVTELTTECMTKVDLRWTLCAVSYVQEGGHRYGSIEEAKTNARRLLRSEIYKDIRAQLERLRHSLIGRDLRTSLDHVEKLLEITRP